MVSHERKRGLLPKPQSQIWEKTTFAASVLPRAALARTMERWYESFSHMGSSCGGEKRCAAQEEALFRWQRVP